MRGVALAALGVLALSGCGGGGQSKVAQANTTHEYPSPRPPAPGVSGGEPDAVAAIRAFANAYINWTADSVASQMRSLAAHSIGQARSAMQLAAGQTAGDYELQRGGIANSGTVEAIAPLAGHRDEYVVVTRELTTATDSTAYQGLRPAWHVALASVVKLGDGRWVLSRWQPEN